MRRPKSKAVKRNVSQPLDWWAAFEAKALEEGYDLRRGGLSAWIGMRCRAAFTELEQDQFSERGPNHRVSRIKPIRIRCQPPPPPAVRGLKEIGGIQMVVPTSCELGHLPESPSDSE